MPPDVIKVAAAPDYSIVAEFETGEVRHFDMRPYLDYPAFAALKGFRFQWGQTRLIGMQPGRRGINRV